MKDKPILFNTEMVQAILEGRKTKTRRLLKKPFEIHPNGMITKQSGNERSVPYKPPYQAGDILWVRETWCRLQKLDGNENFIEGSERYYYRANDYPDLDSYLKADGSYSENVPWKPSIHMSKGAARIFLKVTDVRIERLQDMTADECLKEGLKLSCHRENADCSAYPCSFKDTIACKDKFKKLWDSTIKKNIIDMYSWDANPWVWVIEFERVKL